jgi:hypothetical protein
MKCLLLGTAGCHLCEDAEALIGSCLPTETAIKIVLIDIAEQPEWQQDYAVRIPVLLHEASMQTLDWPFTESQAIHFFNTITS